MGANNTMIKVDGRAIKTPSVFDWSINDVSNSDAGRTQNGLMHKNRVTRKRKIVLKWSNPTRAEAKEILEAFAPEYFDVTYPDPLTGTTVTKKFYSGDQSSPVKVWSVNQKVYSEVSFDIIER